MTRLRLRLVEPTLDEAHLMRLLRERLGRIELEQMVEGIRIRATQLHRLPGTTRDLLKPKETAEPLAHFLERLQARLGRDTVRQVSACPDHRPERAWRYCHPREQAEPAAGPHRPFWLLPEPRRLRSRANRPCLAGELRLLAGPERVESGWWDGSDVTRDYYIATDERGGRFWVFRNRRTPHDWYLHGIFA
jgi:protein ImuB